MAKKKETEDVLDTAVGTKEDNPTEVVEDVATVVEDKFYKQDLINSAKVLGYEKYVLVGALHGAKEEKLSKKELDSLVNKFLSN